VCTVNEEGKKERKEGRKEEKKPIGVVLLGYMRNIYRYI
jgi:hypothetical protein